MKTVVTKSSRKTDWALDDGVRYPDIRSVGSAAVAGSLVTSISVRCAMSTYSSH
jgi:hypothetical protein